MTGADAGDVRCMSLAALSGNILAHAKRKVAGSHVAAECARELETYLSWALQAQANGGQCDASGIKAELGVCSYLASLNEENPERSAAYLQRAEDVLKAAHPAKDPEARLYLAFALHDKSRQQNGLNGQDANLLFTLLEDVCVNHLTELGNADVACYYLGLAYLLGQGYSKDDNKAYQWMSTAQQMGFDCQEVLKGFKKKLMGGYVYKG